VNHCSKFNDTNLAIRYGEAAVEENSHEPVALNTRPEDYCGQRKALIFQSIHIVRRASLFKHDTDFPAIDNALKVIATDAAIIARTVAGQASPQTGNFRYAGRTLEDLNDVPALDLLESETESSQRQRAHPWKSPRSMHPIRSLRNRLRRGNRSSEERSGRLGRAYGIPRGFGPGNPYRVPRDELAHVLREVTPALERRSQRHCIEKESPAPEDLGHKSFMTYSADLFPAEDFRCEAV
jgi:hypothetical protein